MADLNELERVGKHVAAAAKAPIDVVGAIWADTRDAIAAYLDDPGEFQLSTQGQQVKMRMGKNRQVSYLELTRAGKTIRIEVYEIDPVAEDNNMLNTWMLGGMV